MKKIKSVLLKELQTYETNLSKGSWGGSGLYRGFTSNKIFKEERASTFTFSKKQEERS